jgi:hypothetical protein
MPVCTKCGETKVEKEFSWRWRDLGIRQKVCKACRKVEVGQWYEQHREEHLLNVRQNTEAQRQKLREYVWDYLSRHPCVECGEADPVVLEFDHLSDKERTVSEMVTRGVSVEKIQSEIEKCQVLCANCHRRKTTRERGWFRGDQTQDVPR